jgi:hypothetical protein
MGAFFFSWRPEGEDFACDDPSEDFRVDLKRVKLELIERHGGQFVSRRTGPSHSLDRTRKPGTENFSICSGTD